MKKSIQFLDLYKRLYPFIQPYTWRAVLALLVTLPIGTLDAAVAAMLKPYMDVVVLGGGGGGSRYLPALIIVFAAVQSLFEYASAYLNTWVSQKITNGVKISLFRKLVYCDAVDFDRATSGSTIFHYSNDANEACAGLLDNIRFFLTRVTSSLSLIAILFWNSWILASLSVVLMVVAIYPLTRIRKRLQQLTGESIANATTLITNYTEAFNGNRVVTSYSLQEHLIARMEETLNGLFRISIKMVQRTRTLSFFAHVILSAGIAATVWLQGYLISIGHLTPGNFVSFIAALLMLYTPLKKMGGTVNAVNLSILALERVFTRLESEPTIQSKPNAIRLSAFRDSIVYDNVCFSYTQECPVLKYVNLEIKSGQSVAFVGNSGGGKTTLVNLLPRFYDVTSGSICIDGLDIRDVELFSLRDLISIVFQDNFLFSGTIRENILFGRRDASPEDVNEAIRSSCLSEFLETLPQGLDSEIGERGVLLSGGQKQRIAIARAFIKKSPIVILDEATSALDNKSEAIVQQAIENLMQNRTVLIIAHRLTTVIHADMIVVINQGVIAETGTHESLFSKPEGIYRSLYENQFR